MGCGVIGLTAASAMREAGLDVRIVTAELPQATTRAWPPRSGTRTKPTPKTACSPGEADRSRSSKSSPVPPESGVRMREGVEIWRQPVPDPWWAGAVPGVRRCTEDELPPGYTGRPRFRRARRRDADLPRLPDGPLRRVRGKRAEDRTLSSLDEAGDARVVVNCVGARSPRARRRPFHGADTGPDRTRAQPRPRTFRARRREP